MPKRAILGAAAIVCGAALFAWPVERVHADEFDGQTYFPPTDPRVVEAIERWRDQKLGMLMHWGPYSQWGVVESWSICSEDEGWCVRRDDNYARYKADYEALKSTFHPIDFAPAKWARAAREAGMRYAVFTTKHHDGFCMFDTKQTDYKITDSGCPFHTHPKADVTREVFDAFRAEGLMIGAYFSKPDWHSPDYWWPNFATPDRNPNYDIRRYPERWERFVQFTHNQIGELLTNYGRVDILWLDGGWVRPHTDEEVRAIRSDLESRVVRPQSQDIRMDEIAAKARALQPGVILVDRAVEGPHQNYLTPENRIPEQASEIPWESCMTTSSGGWSYAPNSTSIEVREAIRRLLDVVSKGGNLLLNFAPSPAGDFDRDSYRLLRELADWMRVNGEAIYETRIAPISRHENTFFTRSKSGSMVYAIILSTDDDQKPPVDVRIPFLDAARIQQIRMLGADGELEWTAEGEGVVAHLAPFVVDHPPCGTAWSLRIELDR